MITIVMSLCLCLWSMGYWLLSLDHDHDVFVFDRCLWSVVHIFLFVVRVL